ncbi:MAG: DUF5320 domain-containing protein [Marinilabiliaceae bacterium]|nr:DUF5320 domain-containing protein [Marinilabiliaceae bacterium]
MPKMNGTGPEGKGPQTGRKLGLCNENEKESLLLKLGKGLGLRRKSGGGKGLGKRLKSDLK